MQPRVIAILLAHSRSEQLQLTIESLRAQSRQPDKLILADLNPKGIGVQEDTDDSPPWFGSVRFDSVTKVRPGSSLGRALQLALADLKAEQKTAQETEQKAEPKSKADSGAAAAVKSEWLWILREGSQPAPRALFELAAAAENSPSAEVVGPMLLEAKPEGQIASLGETLSRFGAAVQLVEHELDQGQHDDLDDVLAVEAEGSLVRRSLWELLGGFDPKLPSIDSGLDFSVRTRLSGKRVILAPKAKVVTAGPPETFGGARTTPGKSFRIARAAQLHRRLVYSPVPATPLHWLSLFPLAVARSVADLLRKYPERISGEFLAAASAAFSPGVLAARSRIRSAKTASWESLLPLRMPTRELQARRALERDLPEEGEEGSTGGNRAQFFANGGVWALVILAIIGLISFGSFIAAAAITGGGLRPLSDSVGELWANIGYGWRNLGAGLQGAADPFAAVLALMGTLTFWNPSSAIVFTYLAALPLAGAAGWFATRRLSAGRHLPIVGAVLWALAPPFLAALAEGRFSAVMAHLLLPWLLVAGLKAARSWGAAATASILLAATAASSPSIAPALAVLLVVLWISHPLSLHRTGWIPIPALILAGPLVIGQILAGNALGLLADPGVPVSGNPASWWQLAIADPALLGQSWTELLGRLGVGFGLAEAPAGIVILVLLAPMIIGIVISALLPKSRRGLVGMGIAALGLATALLSARIQVGGIANSPIFVWTGSGLSLYWLGLAATLLIGLGSMGSLRVLLGIVATLAVGVLAIPLLAATILGTSAVTASDGRIMPALVVAESATESEAGTLVITSLGEAGISVRLERGAGAMLDDQSTLISARKKASEMDERLQTLAGNLAVPSGYLAADEFRALDIEFVLVPASSEDDSTHRQIVDALDGNEVLSAVGETRFGSLWQYSGPRDEPTGDLSSYKSATRTGYLILLGVVFGAALLLAIPTGSPRRRDQSGRSSELQSAGEEND